MAMIEFVRNYTDHSTDRGYQFEFRCDHCSSGYMSSYEASLIGTAGGLLQAAGSLFGGILGNAGSSSYEIQRAIGGPAHDRALQQAVAEVKQKFKRCQRCGNWVCAEICWNETAGQCTGCTPKYEQEAISLRTQAQVYATRQQMMEKAAVTDYVSNVDMNPDAQVTLRPGNTTPQLSSQPATPAPNAWQPVGQVQSPPTSGQWLPVEVSQPAPPALTPASTQCSGCGTQLNGSKFCPNCGQKATPPEPKTCTACGHVSTPAARFCDECGNKLV